jgi:hypothetical protein
LLGNRLLIEGVAGSGKSTLLQWTVESALDAQEKAVENFPDFVSVVRRVDNWLGWATPRGELYTELRKKCRDLLGPPEKAASRSASQRQARSPAPQAAGVSISDDETDRQTQLLNTPPWWERTPFLLRLRYCTDGRLPSPEALPEAIAREAGSSYHEWVRARLRDGNALLLLDGIDEVPRQRREEIRQSIDLYFQLYDRCQFVVTSRPAAVRGASWARLFDLFRASVRPMAPIDVEKFIENWHQALDATTRSSGSYSTHSQTVQRITGQILASPALTQLSETPLLCAAICYLHRVRRGDLPRRAVRLYKELCEQLVHRLDEQRLSSEGMQALAPALHGLDLDDKLQLLSSLAHFMVREEISALEIGLAEEQIKKELSRLRKLEGRTPYAVLDTLQERSGILRGASEKEVDFTHNVLKSYLAAGRFAEEDSVVDLIRKALATSDPDLPVLAAARAGAPYRKRLIEKLLSMAEQSLKDKRVLLIMALRCGAMVGVHENVGARLSDLEARIFPPQSGEEARQLAELGERVIRLLQHNPDHPPQHAAACVRALRLIGGDLAQNCLQGYATHRSEEVIDELAQAMNPLLIREIYECVCGGTSDYYRHSSVRHVRDHHLAVLDGDIRVLRLYGSGLQTLETLRRFKRIRSLIVGNMKLDNVSPLVEMKQLERLSILDSQVTEVRDLVRLTALRYLSVGGCRISVNHPALVALRGRGVKVDTA